MFLIRKYIRGQSREKIYSLNCFVKHDDGSKRRTHYLFTGSGFRRDCQAVLSISALCQAIEIEDFLFWIFSALFLFVQIYHTTSGSIRWHFVLGVVFGAVISSFALWKAEKVYKKIYTRNQKKSFRFLAKKNKKRYHN